MKQHTIIGRLGSLDNIVIPNRDNEIATTLDLFVRNKGLRYGIGTALNNIISLGIIPTEIGLDFLILSAHVYAADTRISRATEAQDSWTREIHLSVPVSDPDRWADTTHLLERMLNFLTGDIWTFNFRPRPRGFIHLIPRKRTRSDSYDSLALFSGGLDSLIGGVDSLETGIRHLFISHAGESATSDAQDACFEGLKRNYKKLHLDRLRVWMNFPKGIVQGVGSENTMRARSFLFFGIGVFAGTGFENNFTLHAPENGLIALNVPLDPLRLGSLSTRTMHPFYIARWNELLVRVGVSGHIDNPYWNKTKGEMVMACVNPDVLNQLIPISMSCSSPTKGRWSKFGIEHCGYCLPCLIRRAALEKALGHGADLTRYTLSDLAAQVLNTRHAKGQQIRSFQFAIERLHTNPGLARLLIYKPGPLSDLTPENISALEEVYRRGMDEVAALLAHVRTQSN